MLPVLPLSLPPFEPQRRDRTAAIARRVAPLFGLYDEASPFGESWVVDVRRVLLKELAQGRPLMSSRTTGSDKEAQSDQVTERALAATTLARYGPDSRAAIVLEGVNRVLLNQTAALKEAVTADFRWHLDHAAGIDVRQLYARALVFWAIGVGELWASYPVLVWAGLWARQVQRAADFDVHVVPRRDSHPLPSEYGYAKAKTFSFSPDRLNLVDDILSVFEERSDAQQISSSDDRWMSNAAHILADVIAEVAQGDGDQPGIVWVPPLQTSTERVATAYVVPMQIAREFSRRLNISISELSSTWAPWNTSSRSPLVDDQGEPALEGRPLALTIRVLECLAEWSSRREAGPTMLSAEDHATLQRSIADTARRGLLPDPMKKLEPKETNALIVDLAETRAIACRMRALDPSSDGPELRASASTLLTRLDRLASQTAARVVATGPALAHLSRGASDLYEVLGRLGSDVVRAPGDGFWLNVHAHIAQYWDTYRQLLSEGGTHGAVDHYLGNNAGFLIATHLGPEDVNTLVTLSTALRYITTSIIPYRERRAERQPGWGEFLVRGYIQGIKCEIGLLEEQQRKGMELRSSDRDQALGWLDKARRTLSERAAENENSSEDARLAESLNALERKLSLLLDTPAT